MGYYRKELTQKAFVREALGMLAKFLLRFSCSKAVVF